MQRRRRRRRRRRDTCDGDGGVEVLPDLGDHQPISTDNDSPGVDPVDVADGVRALGEDGGSEGVDFSGFEEEGFVG
ncbi:hypothetical protein QJS10_CPB21g01479 [Acorus calamus]|uniref:Uncharacterized protein n=1 Tax=Acorus calamus TaxID=4465 RepID=A0AAV9C575_ACOCL|nr:hypothetical protein QJS10_CPB21g01479 [Acorus calamus]